MEPSVTRFNPMGAGRPIERVVITVDELEAIRLKDFEGLVQEEGAKRMGISQPTFQRALTSARSKIADALANGKCIMIEGGDYVVVGRGMRRLWRRGR